MGVPLQSNSSRKEFKPQLRLINRKSTFKSNSSRKEFKPQLAALDHVLSI